MSTPTVEPRVLRAGDTWAWRREDLTAYPAGTWALSYYCKAASANFNFSASADGANFAVSRTAAQTAGITAGVYQWFAFVTSGAERRQVDQGTVEVLPDMGVAGNLDTRSLARKMLDALDAALLAYNQSGSLAQSYQINNRSITYRTGADLRADRDYWAARVAEEESRERLAAGKPSPGKLFVQLR